MSCIFAHGSSQLGTAPVDATCSVEGDVTDSTGRTSIANAEVAAVARQNFATTTDAHGHFVLKGVKAGDYAIYAKKEHYAVGITRRVALAPGAILQHFDLQLPTESAIAGRVLDENRNPVANAKISLWTRVLRNGRSTFAFAGGSKSDKQGRYKVSGLSKGSYYIEARLNAFAVQALEVDAPDPKKKANFAFRHAFYGGGPNADSAIPVHVQASEQREGADFVLRKVRTFCAMGIASFPNVISGEPSVALHLSETSANWTHTVSDSELALNKKFQVCGLMQGDWYTLLASLWLNDTDVGGLARVQFSGNQRDVDLGIDLGVLSLQSAMPVKGKLVIKGQQLSDQVPEGISVAIDPTSRYGVHNESRIVEVDASGSFLLKSVLPDEHWLRVFGLPPGYYVEKATLKGLDLLREPFSPGEGEIEILISSTGSAVSGRVVDKENKPVQDAIVIIAPTDFTNVGIRTRQANQLGEFGFPSNLPPGDYRIVAVAGLLESEAEDPERADKYLSHAKDIRLPSRGQQTLTLTALFAE